MYLQLQVSLGSVKDYCRVDKGLHQEAIYKIIKSVILQLVLQLVFSSVTSANGFINSAV